MSLNYCDIVASWTVETERKEIFFSAFKYNVRQSDTGSEFSVNSDSIQEDECEDVSYRYCQLSHEPTEPDQKPEPCMVQLTCKLPYNVSIVGVEILSESRTQELYDDTDSYIMTTSPKGTVKGANDVTLYRNTASWEKPLNRCSIKFLSLGGRETFHLCQVTVCLTQGSTEVTSPTSTPQLSHFDMNKVKNLVGSMGGNLSERAQAFMTTMEQYQQNQEASFADMEKLIDKSSLSKAGKASETGGGMSRFVSMFASMNKFQKQMAPMKSGAFHEEGMESHMLRSGDNGNINGDNPGAMFSFLKDICGKVSQMRENEDQKKNALLSTEENKTDLPVESQPAQGHLSAAFYSELEQRLLQHIDRVEERMETRINERLQKLEENFNKKLDKILELLSQPVPGSGGGLYESSDDSSVTSGEELTLD